MMEAFHSQNKTVEDSLSYTVLTEVAEFKDTDLATLQPSLHEVIDPQALDMLFSDENETDRSGNISFSYSGCHVCIDSDGCVHVHAAEDNRAVGA